VRRVSPLGGGTAAELLLAELEDGRRVVAKRGSGLAVEGLMLDHLARRSPLPVPRLHHAGDRLLVMDYVETSGPPRDAAGRRRAEEHAAELVAGLHGVAARHYGFGRDTTIGPLAQPNGEAGDWIAFFRDRRLMHMARLAFDEGRIDAGLLAGLERVAGRLGELIGEPAAPSLVHGDLWGGNVLFRGDRVAGFIDPAIYHADPEIELAFATLFGTFGEAFFRRYGEIRPLRPGFFELRRDLYNLYPLLVHARLFGAPYASQAAGIVRRLAG
jgi:fructosamine-3-kinase